MLTLLSLKGELKGGNVNPLRSKGQHGVNTNKTGHHAVPC